VINISNCLSKDNPYRPPAQAAPPRRPAVALIADRRDGRSAGPGIRDAFARAPGAAFAWLAWFVRRRGDRWFATNDSEAYWWGWQITRTRAGLGRRYHDIRFGTLAACARCAAAGARAGAPCEQCLGTGRITLGR